MQYSAVLITLMASLAAAVPTKTGGGGGGGGGGSTIPFDACDSALLYSQPQCCSTDALGGVLDLTCATVSEVPSDADDFKDICASSGQAAKCCTLSAVSGKPQLCKRTR
ncbi:hypothetical protein DHEL01_v207666 [Diaporthe helianthi]|uniref:Fungal hydrophobin n=1 Tax=Diaporthe helianthi TaxID=158607 RepID=A0A2P5HUN0_DIAHE|nr:hypothetical protein DHEL01_v207666 [Diaporthe helianthi]